MIVLPREYLHDQEGMEHAFRWYFENVCSDPQCDGTFNTMLDARFESCDHERRRLVISIEGVRWMSNPSSILHGGVTAAVLDMAMGLLCRYCTGGYMTPTIDMSVSYLRPAPLGKKLMIEAEVTKPGFSICHVIGRMWVDGAEDAVLATSAGSYYVTHRPD